MQPNAGSHTYGKEGYGSENGGDEEYHNQASVNVNVLIALLNVHGTVGGLILIRPGSKKEIRTVKDGLRNDGEDDHGTEKNHTTASFEIFEIDSSLDGASLGLLFLNFDFLILFGDTSIS